jgi:hypothetical protein
MIRNSDRDGHDSKSIISVDEPDTASESHHPQGTGEESKPLKSVKQVESDSQLGTTTTDTSSTEASTSVGSNPLEEHPHPHHHHHFPGGKAREAAKRAFTTGSMLAESSSDYPEDYFSPRRMVRSHVPDFVSMFYQSSHDGDKKEEKQEEDKREESEGSNRDEKALHIVRQPSKRRIVRQKSSGDGKDALKRSTTSSSTKLSDTDGGGRDRSGASPRPRTPREETSEPQKVTSGAETPQESSPAEEIPTSRKSLDMGAVLAVAPPSVSPRDEAPQLTRNRRGVQPGKPSRSKNHLQLHATREFKVHRPSPLHLPLHPIF